jgi:hypothetical protein
MEDTKLAWLAGILDGEGVIGFYEIPSNKKGITYQNHVRIVNADPNIILECDAIISEIVGHRISHGRDLRKDRPHVYWYISVNHQYDIIKLLSLVEPYMIGKKAQAHLLLELLRRHNKGTKFNKMEIEVIDILKRMKREKMTPTNGNTEPSIEPYPLNKKDLDSRACVTTIQATFPLIIDGEKIESDTPLKSGD